MAPLTPAPAWCPGLVFAWLLVLSSVVAPLLHLCCGHKHRVDPPGLLFALVACSPSDVPPLRVTPHEGKVPGEEDFSHAPKLSSPHAKVLISYMALLGAAKK